MLIRLTLFAFVCFLATSRAEIKCDFRYSEYDQTATNGIAVDEASKIDLPGIVVVKPEIKGIFDCDDGFEKVPILASRFNGNYDEDDDIYETLPSSCDALRSTIRPSRLSNLKGEMTHVHQSSNFIQEIHIEKCAFKTRHNSSSYEECHAGRHEPSSQKHICREIHSKVILTAGGGEGSQRYEEFYFPSNCVCELVQLKKSP